VVLEHLHGLAVGNPFHELEQTHAQQHHRLDARPAVVVTVGRFQSRTGLDQQRVDVSGEQPVAVVRRELIAQQHIDAVQRSLQGKLGKAHP